MIVALTGGIGSGKSYVCKLLAERGISVYDCDAHAKEIDAHLSTTATRTLCTCR